ncbi:MAG: DMT family transporter [Desulfobacula sp.]|nr:DMT family transporter [Desulfobacula sp.]
MNWFAFSLISSITLSLREFSVKRAGKNIPSAVMSFGMNFFMFLIILVLNVLSRNYHPLTLHFAGILITAAILDSLATLLYLSSIKTGDLSKIIPMLCFIPVIQLFVTPVLIHENLSVIGMMGVFTVVSGSYLLYVESFDGILSPIRSAFRDKSAMMMLGAAFLWGITSSFHKMGIRQTNALFWGACEIGLISLILSPFALRAGKTHWASLKKTILPGFLSSFTVLSYYFAIGLGPVAYVSSVRRLGVLFTMMMGILILKEGIRRLGFLGGIIMIAGAVLISLFG